MTALTIVNNSRNNIVKQTKSKIKIKKIFLFCCICYRRRDTFIVGQNICKQIEPKGKYFITDRMIEREIDVKCMMINTNNKQLRITQGLTKNENEKKKRDDK